MNDPQQPSPVERITTAAMALVAERGMSGVTMSAVAERAGVSRQTVYNHFSDIDAIVLTAHEHHSAMDHAAALLATAATPASKIDLLVRHTVAAQSGGLGALAIEHSLAPRAQEVLRRHVRESRDLIASILREGTESRSFRAELDPELDARLIQGALGAAGEASAEPGADVARIAAVTSRTILTALERPDA